MENANQQHLEDVEFIKDILVAKATGGTADDAEYSQLRHGLMVPPDCQ